MTLPSLRSGTDDDLRRRRAGLQTESDLVHLNTKNVKNENMHFDH